MPHILVVDDERSICELLDIALRRDGHKVETVTGGEAARRKIDGALYDVIVTDIKMPGVGGVEVLRHAHQISPDSAVILMTAVDDYEAAVEAVKAGGASDYIRKSPGLVDEVKLAIAKKIGDRQPVGFRRHRVGVRRPKPPLTIAEVDAQAARGENGQVGDPIAGEVGHADHLGGAS